jgi:hypothetical protein
MSLGAPLGIDVTADSAAAEAALDRVGKKLDQVKTKTREATVAARDMNKEMAGQLRAGAIAARGTAGAAGLSGMAGGMAAGGTMGALAGVAAASAVVLQMVQRFAALNEESLRRRLGYEQEIADTAQKAKDARGASAERGLGQEQAYRKAMFAGGPDAIKRADQMIKEGIDPAEAYAAAADSQGAAGRYGHKKIGDLLAQVARRGGDVSDAAKKLKDRPWMAEGDGAASGLMGLRPGDVSGWGDYNLETDPFLKQGEKARKLAGQKALADRSNATDGAATAGRFRDLRMATDPEGQLRGEAIEKIAKSIEAIERLADGQSKGYALIADIFSPGGSFETQLVRAMRDRDRALTGDP